MEKTAAIQKKMNAINLTFNGDATRAKREFETATTVNDRVGILNIQSGTSPLPFLKAAKQITTSHRDNSAKYWKK
ncbi:MAG: hypothetical protein IPL22_20140 [Bacteroidetes bacterium]|nr:hypothetical protein [Bacteroidota bacterium]